jgi:hypothetical protein
VIDAVLSYHANPDTCGVTKFNMQLAEKLGVPHLPLHNLIRGRRPLVSVKWSELDPVPWITGVVDFDVLWHDRHPDQVRINRLARNVFYADELGCPSTLRGDSTRKGLTILSFGMAHKFQAPLFEKLKTLLDATHSTYTICVSSAIHEGSPWDETTKAHTQKLRDLFGDHLRWLGFLADDALAREIRDAHMVALFYDPAVRANNTTLWAALDAGTPVITNLDAQSPPGLIHNRSVFDLARLTEWPEAAHLREVRWGGRKAAEGYSWDAFLAKLQAVHA